MTVYVYNTQLNQALDETQQDTLTGSISVRKKLSIFGNNEILTLFFAALNNILSFVEIYRGRIQSIVDRLSPDDIPGEVLQEAAEDLGTVLGQVLEVKINANNIKKRLE